MMERPHSRYTRAKTWSALYSQHINAGYALVPFSKTNNSIDVISCLESKEATQDLARDTRKMTEMLMQHAGDCYDFYTQKHTLEHAPTVLAAALKGKRFRSAVVLARSSDYHHYHLEDHPGFNLVICGLHDSYLHLPVWETGTNTRYRARDTRIPLDDPAFVQLRCTPVGHRILLGALVCGDKKAHAFAFGNDSPLPRRTQTRLKREVQDLQDRHYQGRPLAFLTEAESQEIASKISAGLTAYHARKRQAH